MNGAVRLAGKVSGARKRELGGMQDGAVRELELLHEKIIGGKKGVVDKRQAGSKHPPLIHY